MPPSVRSLFRHRAIASGLVTPADIETARGELRAADQSIATASTITDKQLADKLVEMGRLNSYQAAMLLSGLTKLDLGSYRILDLIGQGGMGQVFKAEHKVMGRIVAVKVLPKHKTTPEATASFMREIRAQAQMDHTNLVRALDAGHDGNVDYLVTEYIPGTDLRRYVRSRGPLSMNEAATIISQAALGLQYAHQRGLVHRDVKPGNILVTPDGLTKVSDLGLAGWFNDAEDAHAGKIVGTADYLPPEQILSPGAITPAGDIYSLGCTLYYAVTGKVPFPGGTAREKAHRHCTDTPYHPRHFNPALTDDFLEVLADMMNKDPQLRIQTAAEVVRRLARWAGKSVPAPTEPDETAGVPPRANAAPPPLPADAEDTASSFEGLIDFPAIEETDSPSQASQGTDPIASADQETLPNPLPRRLVSLSRAMGSRLRRTSPLMWLLVILAPVALVSAIVVLVLMLKSLAG